MTSRDTLERPDALARDGRAQGARDQLRGAMELPGMDGAGPGGARQAIAHRRAPRQGAAPCCSPAPTLRTQPTAKRQRTQSQARHAREPPSLWVRTVGRRGGDHGAPAPPPRPRPRRPWPLWPWGRRAATRSLPPGRLAGSLLPLVLNGRTADRRCSYRWFLPFWSRRQTARCVLVPRLSKSILYTVVVGQRQLR